MSNNPTFTSVAKLGLASLAAANTGRDGSGTLVALVAAAPTAGTKIERLVLKSTGQPANSNVLIFINDGTTSWLYDEINISGTPAAGSTTVAAWSVSRKYESLVLPSGYTLKCCVTVIPTSGAINVEAFGGDLT